MAVSYTHLDVYKRQVIDSFKVCRIEGDCSVEAVFSIEILFVVEESDSFAYPGIHIISRSWMLHLTHKGLNPKNLSV